MDDVIKLIQKAENQKVDLIEIRLDYLKNYDCIKDISNHSKTPLIATNKSTLDHGYFSGSETERQNTLLDAARNGFEYVDIDIGTPNKTQLITNLKQNKTKIIVSFHDYIGTPTITNLNMILVKQLSLNADICKIVTTAKKIEDNLEILNFVSKASKKTKLVCFTMGEQGKISRLLSPIFGGFFTFASLDNERKTAKGQLAISELKLAYKTLGLKYHGYLGKN